MHQRKKQGFATYKLFIHFLFYFLKYSTKVIVSHSTIRKFFIQKELRENRDHWIISLQEFDFEMKPSQIIKGHSLCMLALEFVSSLDVNIYFSHDSSPNNKVSFMDNGSMCQDHESNSWCSHISFYINNGTTPSHLNSTQWRALILNSTSC